MPAISAMRYRPSQYNHTIHDNGRVLLFNSATGALLDITEADHKSFVSACEAGSFEDLAQAHGEFLEGGFVRDADLGELALLQLKYDKERFKTGMLDITLCPTLACNFQCVYCYQDPLIQTGVMDDAVAARIVQFVEMSLWQFDQVNVSWYGGEPLLQPERVISVTRSLKDLCSASGKEFQASVITNGYLLNRRLAEALAEAGIRRVQITLDGPRAVHDSRRPLRTGEGAFATILENILASREYFAVNIRINVDEANVASLPVLYELLRTHGLAERAYVARVHDRALACSDVADCHTAGQMPVEQFAQVEAMSFRELRNVMVLRKKLRPKAVFCSAPTVKFLVVDPQGALYKCWHSIGDSEQSIGSIMFEDQLPFNAPHVKWLTCSPLRYAKCRSCSVYPLCQGGCTHAYVFRPPDEPVCEPIRYNLPDLIRLAAALGRGSTDNG